MSIDLKQYGFAPGTYVSTCPDCKDKYTADKKAWRCYTCALDKKAKTVKAFSRVLRGEFEVDEET